MIHSIPTLIGDSIENPFNALVMMHAAEMLGTRCLFRDRKQLASQWHETNPHSAPLPCVLAQQWHKDFGSIIALDTLDHAADIYGFRLPGDSESALVVGNEGLGISGDVRALAHCAVQIPMVSQRINCLNVAAAAAVGLYYVTRGGGGKLKTQANPRKRRPDLLLMGAGDHIELGSSIRSACAFGWERALVEDRFGVWFGCDRITRSEGRGAARRGRNSIHLIPQKKDTQHMYDEVCVATVEQTGIPLHQAILARGTRQLVVIPDESRLKIDKEDWNRLGRHVQFVHLDLPRSDYVYHYRLIASIVMAEVARQVGERFRKLLKEQRPRRPFYGKAISTAMLETGEWVLLEDLAGY